MRVPWRAVLSVAWLCVACSPVPARPTAAASPATVASPSATSASVADASGPAAQPPTLRLPAVARPSRVDLELWLDPAAKDFRGRAGIDLDVLTATRVLWLNATDLAVDDAQLTRVGASAAPATPLAAHVVPGGEDFVGLVFDEDVRPGQARLAVSYRGRVDTERSRGIYAQREADGRAYLYTFFEPIDARRAFPGFDEPGYKVPWRLVLHVPKDDVAAANTAVASEQDDGAGTKAVAFEETKPLPSYLVAFVVGPFDVVSAPDAGHHGTKLRFLVPKGRGHDTAYASRVTPRIIGALEDYFGMPYPFGKLDVAVVPRFWGTMEHPGIVALGQPLTLIAPAEQTVRREQDYASIATHELTHYWFGDLVTTAWWDDTWLNEGMTEWLGVELTDAVEPSWHFARDRLDDVSSAMAKDALPTAKKVRQPVERKEDIEASFDGALTYQKGQALLAMLQSWMTPARLQHALRAYVTAHAWGNATSEDLFAALDADSPGMGAVLQSFVEQPGLPTITVTCQGGTLDVGQRRYQPLGPAQPAETWKVPVCVRYPGSAGRMQRACVMLDGEHARVETGAKTCPGWVLGNAEASGYYHVAYAPRTFRSLLAPSSGIDLEERIGVLHDAAALVTSGDLALGDALALVPDAARARERHLARAAAEIVELAPDAAMTDDEAARFAHFVRRLFGARAQELGLRRRPGEGADVELLRPWIVRSLADRGRDPDVRARAHDLALAWSKDSGAIDPDLVGPVLVAAAKSNDPRLFDGLLAKAHGETDRIKVQRMLAALGGFTEPAFVRRVQDLLLGTDFDLRDSINALVVQFGDRDTREVAWSFLQASFDALAARMRDDEVGFELFPLVTRFCDEAHAQSVQALLAPRASRYDGGPRKLANVLDAIRLCASSFERNRASLDAFLASY